MDELLINEVKKAFHSDDSAAIARFLETAPELKGLVNEPIGAFGAPAISCVQSVEMMDVLLAAGADINAKSHWWAGGFGILHTASPEIATAAIERGAVVDIHAAARLGMLDRVKELVEANPESVHEKGGDGQTPLHFAKTVEIAQYLLDHGAKIDALDVDHESTPAQWMLDGRVEVARHLVSQGCKTDILMASAIGDLDLVRKILQETPEAVRVRVDNEHFRKTSFRGGGTIYQWALGFDMSPHQVAAKFGNEDVLQYLFDQSPDDVKMINACWIGDEERVSSLLKEDANAGSKVSAKDQKQLAHAARNNAADAVRLMLKAGISPGVRGQHNATPLHWGSWHGNLAMVQTLLCTISKIPEFSSLLEDKQNDYQGTPLNWACHGSTEGWHAATGDYGNVVEALLSAGAVPPSSASGSLAVLEVLKKHGIE